MFFITKPASHEELRKVADRIQLLEDQFGNLYDNMVEMTHTKALYVMK